MRARIFRIDEQIGVRIEDTVAITDTGHDRVIEVDESGAIVWSAGGLVLPFAAVRLEDGNTLVSFGSGVQFGQVVELSPADSVVWRYPNTVPLVVSPRRTWRWALSEIAE